MGTEGVVSGQGFRYALKCMMGVGQFDIWGEESSPGGLPGMRFAHGIQLLKEALHMIMLILVAGCQDFGTFGARGGLRWSCFGSRLC